MSNLWSTEIFKQILETRKCYSLYADKIHEESFGSSSTPCGRLYCQTYLLLLVTYNYFKFNL